MNYGCIWQKFIVLNSRSRLSKEKHHCHNKQPSLISDPIHSFSFKAAYAKVYTDIGAAIFSKGTTCQKQKSWPPTTGAWWGGGGRLEHEDMHSMSLVVSDPIHSFSFKAAYAKVYTDIGAAIFSKGTTLPHMNLFTSVGGQLQEEKPTLKVGGDLH